MKDQIEIDGVVYVKKPHTEEKAVLLTISGIELRKGSDGYWLSVELKGGSDAMLHIDNVFSGAREQKPVDQGETDQEGCPNDWHSNLDEIMQCPGCGAIQA